MKKVHSHSHQFSLAALFAIFIIFQQISSPAQTTQSLPQFIPPSPNAYSLGKYGDVPISLYTGVPDITIPIWTLQERDLSVDVSLSYHGSGIKVDEIASWVGLGWSLNAGGVITRTVRGQAEHLISDGTLRPVRADIDFYSGPTDYASRNAFAQDQELQAAANGSLDTEPDVYFFNFMGRSGKFVFDKNGQAVLYKQEGLGIKLQYVNTDSFDIIITAEDGTIYEFSRYETTFFPSLSQVHITAWYLSKIKSPRGSEITFEYQGLPSVRHNIRESSYYQLELQSATPTEIVPSIGPAVDMTVSEIAIKKIITDDGWIEFKPGTQPRQDYESPSYSLDSIIVHRSDGSVHRKFKLNTTYFEANNADKYDGIQPEDFGHLNYRLRLDSVQEFGPDNMPAKPAYSFEYWGDNDPATDDVYTLPYRLSPNQDHWGYFNNANNEHIFPGNPEGRTITTEAWLAYGREWANITVNSTFGNGANREPDAEAVKACALKTVHYPTGGHTEYFFETNKWSDTWIGGGLRIEKIIEHTGEAQAKQTDFEYNARSQSIDPRDLYYKVYRIIWDDATHQWDPVPEMLANYGITLPDGPRNADIVKISTFPQAILGGVSPGEYAVVTVRRPRIGFTTTTFSTNFDFTDYYGIDDVYDEIDMFKVQRMFDSQYLTTTSAPGVIYTAVAKTGITDWPYPEPYDNSWKRGVIASRLTYSEDTTLLQKETFLYRRELLDAIPAYKVRSWSSDTQFAYTKYYVPHAWINLEKQIVEQYDENGANPVVTTTEYFYDNLSHAQPTRQVVTTSDSKTRVTVTSYPSDYVSGTAFIDDMKVNHLLSYPIEQVTYLDDGTNKEILSGKVSLFKTDGQGLKDRDLILDAQVPISLSSFRFSDRATAGELPPSGNAASFSPDSRYEPRILYNSYDEMGNVREYALYHNVIKSYQWGYRQSQPTAEVVNAQNNQHEVATIDPSTGTTGVTFGGTPGVTTTRQFTVDYTGTVRLRLGVSGSPSYSTVAHYSGITSGSVTLATGACGITTVTFNNVSPGSHTITIELTTPDSGVPSLGACGEIEYPKNNTVTGVEGTTEFLYENFEENTDSGVVEDAAVARTGVKYFSGDYTVEFTRPNTRNYVLEYWYLDANGKWEHITKPYTGSSMILSEGSAIDDVRIYPSDAFMTNYSYDPLVGVTSMTDPSGVTTFYNYDSLGRLEVVKDSKGNIMKTYSYHFKDQ